MSGVPFRAWTVGPLLVRTVSVVAFVALAAAAAAGAESAKRTLLSSINVPSPHSGACHRVEEVNASLFAHKVIGYDFAGAEAARLSDAIRSVVTESAADASLVRVVLNTATYETMAFEFGGDGCHIMTIDLEFDEMMQAFQRAGINPPFGTTYSRIDRAI